VAQVYSDGAGATAAVTQLTDKLKDVLYSGDIGATLQAYDADLGAIAALSTADGNFIVGNGSTWVAESGNTALASLGVTATAAELNILDGATATTAELNILDGVTASTAEINILDGVTASTAELNILDGVTASTAELNVLDGIAGIASQAEAEAGTASGKLMTPERVSQAIDALAATGSITHLGTLATTSGSSVTLSGLTLTDYKALFVSYSQVTFSTAETFMFGSSTIGTVFSGTSQGWGSFWVDLTSGAVGGGHGRVVASVGASTVAGNSGVSTASTSLTFTSSTASFNAGSIRIYGVK
jgi:hypothetical protein